MASKTHNTSIQTSDLSQMDFEEYIERFRTQTMQWGGWGGQLLIDCTKVCEKLHK